MAGCVECWRRCNQGPVAATSIAAVIARACNFGEMARTGDQVTVLLAMTLTAQLVVAGGFIPVTDRPLMEIGSRLDDGGWRQLHRRPI